MSRQSQSLKRPRPDGALRLDPPVAMLPLAVARGRNQPRIERETTVTYRGTEIEVSWVELDDREQSLLLHLIALGMERGEIVGSDETSGLRESGKVLSAPRVRVRVSAAELMRRAGWVGAESHPGAKSYRALRRTLRRFHAIAFTGRENDRVTYTTNLLCGDTRSNRVTRSLEIVLSARLAVALCVQSGQGHGGAAYFARGGALALRIPYSAMGAVHVGVSKAPWAVANDQGLLDQAPTDWHAGLRFGEVSLRVDRLVGDGTGYNHVALAWQTRWVRIEVGRSTAPTRVVSGLAAVQTIVNPLSPWKAYQGGDYALVTVQLTQGIAVRALYWSGQPPVAGEYGGHSAGGSQAALGISMAF